jgi:hypothetical protein
LAIENHFLICRIQNSRLRSLAFHLTASGWLTFPLKRAGVKFTFKISRYLLQSIRSRLTVVPNPDGAWRRDGKEIFYVAPGNKLMAVPVRITEKSVEVSTPSVLFDIGPNPSTTTNGTRQQYDVTADGRRFLVNVAADATSDTPLTVVSNWLAAAKR